MKCNLKHFPHCSVMFLILIFTSNIELNTKRIIFIDMNLTRVIFIEMNNTSLMLIEINTTSIKFIKNNAAQVISFQKLAILNLQNIYQFHVK